MAEKSQRERAPDVEPQADSAPVSPERRAAMRRMAAYAAAVAPAMTVVMTGEAQAQSWGDTPQQPDCSNPGWRWGQVRRGHSNC